MRWFLLLEHGAVADGWWRGTSARAWQPLWRCRTESHIFLLVKQSRLLPRLAYPCVSVRGAGCPLCLSNTPALSLMLHTLPSGQGLGRCLPNAYSFPTFEWEFCPRILGCFVVLAKALKKKKKNQALGMCPCCFNALKSQAALLGNKVPLREVWPLQWCFLMFYNFHRAKENKTKKKKPLIIWKGKKH